MQKPQLDLMMLTVIRLIIQVTTHFSSIIVRPQKIFQSDSSSFLDSVGGFEMETNAKKM